MSIGSHRVRTRIAQYEWHKIGKNFGFKFLNTNIKMNSWFGKLQSGWLFIVFLELLFYYCVHKCIQNLCEIWILSWRQSFQQLLLLVDVLLLLIIWLLILCLEPLVAESVSSTLLFCSCINGYAWMCFMLLTADMIPITNHGYLPTPLLFWGLQYLVEKQTCTGKEDDFQCFGGRSSPHVCEILGKLDKHK